MGIFGVFPAILILPKFYNYITNSRLISIGAIIYSLGIILILKGNVFFIISRVFFLAWVGELFIPWGQSLFHN